jgi:hypothetical protein
VTRFLTQDELTRYQSWFDNARRIKQLVAKLEIASVHALEAERHHPRTTDSKASAKPSKRPSNS